MMKKITVIILSMLLVLVIGQSAFAKGNVGLTAGYDKRQIDLKADNGENNYDTLNLSISGFKIGLSGNYYLTDKLSLAGELSVFKGSADVVFEAYYDGKLNESKSLNLDKYGYMLEIDFNLFGRYDVYRNDIANVGVQAGMINNNIIIFANKELLADAELEVLERIGLKFPLSFVALGAYADVDVIPGFNVYADLKFPIGFQFDIAGIKAVSFFNGFFYNVTLGASYEISSNIKLGIEGNINNTNIMGILNILGNKYLDLDDEADVTIKNFNFSVGAKLGFSF